MGYHSTSLKKPEIGREKAKRNARETWFQYIDR